MNIKQRMINMAKRRNPETKGMTDEEIGAHIFLKSAFVQGFRKAASPVLTDMNDDGYNDDYRAKRQAILDSSYEDGAGLPGTKEQKENGRLIKEDSPLGLISKRSPL